MTEIKKLTKIALIVDAILWFIFGILLTFLFDMTMNPEGWTNPYLPRLYGGVCFISAIFAILMLRKKEWEEIKFIFEYLIALILSSLILEVTVFATLSPTSQAVVMVHSSNITVEALLSTLGIVAYIKQRE